MQSRMQTHKPKLTNKTGHKARFFVERYPALSLVRTLFERKRAYNDIFIDDKKLKNRQFCQERRKAFANVANIRF